MEKSDTNPAVSQFSVPLTTLAERCEDKAYALLDGYLLGTVAYGENRPQAAKYLLDCAAALRVKDQS